jgi:5-formyltetrahydrofolate cyclo-ligase
MQDQIKIDKALQRKRGYNARNIQQDKASHSRKITDHIIRQPVYQQASTVMWYCHCRSEVRTLPILAAQLATNKRIVIPYCTVDEQGNNHLGLWLLEDIAELKPGTWGILEPPEHRWSEAEKYISVEQLDVIIVPGVSFEKLGGRLGNGDGYYDRLLQTAKAHTMLIGIAYESQIVDQVLMYKHDVFMHRVITEQAIYVAKTKR